MSSTYTVHGLARIFAFMQKLPGINISKADGGSNQMLLRYMAKNYNLLAEDAKHAGNLVAAGFDNSDALNRWLDTPSRDVFKIPANSQEAFLGSVYDFDQKWKSGLGERDDIKKYVAFGLTGKAYMETGFAETEDGSTLMFWYPKVKQGYNLYCEAANKYKDLALYTKESVELVLPEVNIESEEGSYGLEGSQLGHWTIEESTYVNSLTLNRHGAKAKSVVKVNLTKCFRPAPKVLVFDKPFAVGIWEKEMKYPAFVAYCDKGCWKKS